MAGDAETNKLRFGYIAQDILKTLNEFGLDDSAIVWQDFTRKPNYYQVIKEEFIALNTWQIQKAKSRIADLENTVAELKAQLQTLTAG